jgi:hypothetical protein
LRMADIHADMQGFDFHAGNLTTDGHGCTRIFQSEKIVLLLVLVPWRGGLSRRSGAKTEVKRRRLVLEKSWLTTPQNALGSLQRNEKAALTPLSYVNSIFQSPSAKTWQ